MRVSGHGAGWSNGTSLPAGEASQEPTAEEVHRAFHLRRVASQFRTTINANGARRLARLVTLDDDGPARG